MRGLITVIKEGRYLNTMGNILGYLSSWYIMSPQEEKCNCGEVSAWGLLIGSGFTIMGWNYLSSLDSKGCCLFI